VFRFIKNVVIILEALDVLIKIKWIYRPVQIMFDKRITIDSFRQTPTHTHTHSPVPAANQSKRSSI